MAKPPEDEPIEGEWRVLRGKPPESSPYDWTGRPWVPPTQEESDGIARFLGGLLLAGAVGAFSAWWKQHH
jgi:hypothetical protein